jgi:archaellum component FlaC
VVTFQVKNQKQLDALTKPYRQSQDKDMPMSIELIEKLTKKVGKLEKQLNGYQKIVIEYAEQVEELKRRINHGNE